MEATPKLSDSNTGPIQVENTIETTRHYEGRIFNVRVDTVELPGGRRSMREIVEHSDAVCMVPVDDDGNVLVRFEHGARGVLHASQVSVGEDNALSIRVYGEKQGFEWRQEEPNTLQVKPDGAPLEIWRRGHGYVAEKSPAAARASSLPAGHPEAFHEAFANVYRNAADTIRARLAGVHPDPLALDYPTVDDGLRGMLFIETVIRSARSNRKWIRVPAR